MYSEPYAPEVLVGNIVGVVVAAPLLKEIKGEIIVHFAYKVRFEVVVSGPFSA